MNFACAGETKGFFLRQSVPKSGGMNCSLSFLIPSVLHITRKMVWGIPYSICRDLLALFSESSRTGFILSLTRSLRMISGYVFPGGLIQSKGACDPLFDGVFHQRASLPIT